MSTSPAVAEQRLTIGIDIGGTAVKLGAVAGDGAVVAATEIPSPVHLPQKGAILAIALAARKLILGCGETAGSGKRRRIAAVGIGCAGLVDGQQGVVHTSPNLPHWHDAPLGSLTQDELGVPTFVLNDANAFTLAEARLGAGAGASPIVGLTLGTGVGGAIVMGGRLAAGAHGFAGEVGHMSVDYAGPPCPCGNRGCLELYVGRRGLVAAYLQRAAWRPGTPGYELTAGDRERIDPQLLCAAAQQGDRAAREAFAAAGEILGVGLANLANLIDPQAFVIGGGISLAGELLLAPARETLQQRAMMGAIVTPDVRAAALGMQAGFVGAALFASDRLGVGEGVG